MTNPINKDWWLEEPLDFEHKKYTFLAYTQELDKQFSNGCFSPWLLSAEETLETMIVGYHAIKQFTSRLTHSEWILIDSVAFMQTTDPADTSLLCILEVLEFSMPILSNKIELGKQLWYQNPTLLWK